MRPYDPISHYQYIYHSLKSEGLRDDEITFETDKTYVTDEGFFSYRMIHGYPFISHFMVDRDKRSFFSAKHLMDKMGMYLIRKGYAFGIFEVIPSKGYIRTFLQYMGCEKPYDKHDGNEYYFVPLRRTKHAYLHKANSFA